VQNYQPVPISGYHDRRRATGALDTIPQITPELFPTDVRLRANGICHTFGRAATIVSPFIVLWLSQGYGTAGVLALMVSLLAVQIVAVWGWGVEPRQRSLEELDSAIPLSAGAEIMKATHR
jgi:MFS transporter, putative metabolite:H+ symporter